MFSASPVWPTYQFLLSYDYRLLSYEYWISDDISVIWTVTAHAPCHVNIRPEVYAVALLKNPQKTNVLFTPKARQNHVSGEQKPLDRLLLHARCRPERNHACQFLWRWVKDYWCGEGSNFGLFHWLASSPLKRSRNTVQTKATSNLCLFLLKPLADVMLVTLVALLTKLINAKQNSWSVN